MSGLMQNKKMLIGGAVVLLALGAYLFLGGGTAPSPGFSVTDTFTSDAPDPDGAAPSAEAASLAGSIEQELINELLNLKNITLDRSVLDSPVYASLQDFSRPIDPESVGRPNPFAPYDATATSTSNSGSLPF